MSKQGKRKITVELPKSKDLGNRPSVFERLGTKKASSAKKTSEHCRQWAQHGSCAYGKSCKFAATHTLISPSKQRAANNSNKDNDSKRNLKEDSKSRLHSTVVVRRTPEGDGEWDQNDLEYADTDVLEKRRQELQRELELQLKMDTGKDMRKDKKKPVSSSSSSRSSSSSSASSSSSGSSSSSSSGRNARRKIRKGKSKKNSSSSSEGDVPSKRKFVKNDSSKQNKGDSKKSTAKKDDKQVKKQDAKKKMPAKSSIGKKSLSPGKKSGGTPPITSKNIPKSNARHAKSPVRKDRNKSVSKDREKDRDRKQRDKDKDRGRRARSRTPKKGRSRSPRRVASSSRDNRKKDSSEQRSRPVSPKKPVRRDASAEKRKKKSPSRDRGRDNKDKSSEKRKDKSDDKDRHDRKDRGRDRKDTKRDDSKRRGRDRGLGSGGDRGLGSGSDRGLGGGGGLEKPSKPMERLLPRPEERLAALAAITNRNLDDKASTTSKDRQDMHSDRGGRKQDRERDRSSKRDRMESIDREHGDYDLNRQYDHDREYDRRNDGEYNGPRQDDRGSPGYQIQGRDRHFDPGYDTQRTGRDREYPDDDERYRDQMSEHREMGYDDRRPPRERSWEGRRSNSMERDRGFPHPRKEWEADDYRGGGGDWNRDRHWPPHDQQMEWGDKEGGDNWHHRGGRPGPPRGRVHDEYRGMRLEERRRPRAETETSAKETPPAAAAPPATPRTVEEKDVPDDLSEISDDPDDILNRDDMIDQHVEEESQPAAQVEDSSSKIENPEKESTQDTSVACDEKDAQDLKDDEEGLDFEEISDGELEEERARAGLGDALGVDWASLVADVHRREQVAPAGGARDRWKPERVLARLPLSVHMAGKEIVQNVLRKNAECIKAEQSSEGVEDSTGSGANVDQVKVNGDHKEGADIEDTETVPNVDALNPVAAIQVATEKRKRQRAILFGSGCEITRGLSARRDLALRRYLCNLPIAERTGQTRVAPQPSLFHTARALLMQAPVN